MQITTVGLDLAKNVFQVHGITADGTVAFNRSLRPAQIFNPSGSYGNNCYERAINTSELVRLMGPGVRQSCRHGSSWPCHRQPVS
jgi:hypothetical protein